MYVRNFCNMWPIGYNSIENRTGGTVDNTDDDDDGVVQNFKLRVSEFDSFIHYLIKLVDIFDCWTGLYFCQSS